MHPGSGGCPASTTPVLGWWYRWVCSPRTWGNRSSCHDDWQGAGDLEACAPATRATSVAAWGWGKETMELCQFCRTSARGTARRSGDSFFFLIFVCTPRCSKSARSWQRGLASSAGCSVTSWGVCMQPVRCGAALGLHCVEKTAGRQRTEYARCGQPPASTAGSHTRDIGVMTRLPRRQGM